MAGIKASGYTPIGRSLQVAAQALPAEGPRSVVLVSDGEDTCAPPAPCDVAKQLKAAGTDLVVHTIGFKVNAAARAQLSCVAAATGGTYREAASGAALGAVLTNRVQRAIRPYTAVGRPIRGGATQAAAPTITPGQYLDTYEKGGKSVSDRDGTTKYYAARLREGDTPYFSATIIPLGIRVEQLGTMQVIISLVDRDDDLCVGVNSNAFDIGLWGKVSPQTAVLSPEPVGDEWSDTCAAGQPVYLKVERLGDAYRLEQLPMEIAFRAEPPVSSPGPAAAAERSTTLPPPAEADPAPVEAGFSFNDAPELVPGTYADEIVPGETRYFKVRLGWGQRLSYRITVPAAGLRIQSAAIYTKMASPLRAELDQAVGATRDYQLIGGTEDQTISGSTEAPVRYANRDSTKGRMDLLSVDGDYYLVLDATYPIGEKDPFTMPYQLTLAVDGAVEQGPTYVTDPQTSASPTPTPSASATPTDVDFVATAGSSGPPGGWLVWSGAATAGAVLLGAAVLATVRRRRVS